MSKLLNILFCLLLVMPCMHANTKIDSVQNDRYMLFYYQDRTDVQYNYLDNAYQIARIKDILSRSPRIDSIVIYAYSSPEGSPKRNKWLAERRAETAKQFILNSLPNKNILHPNNILLRPMGENWEGLEKELEANYHLLNRDRVMKIIRAKVPTETKKWRLQQLDNGFTYKWIIQHHMPELRVATWICVYVPMPEITEKSMSVEETLPPVEPQLLPNALPVEVVPIPDFGKKRTLFALKTNLLYDALTALNVELEVPVGNHFSVMFEDVFPWWSAGPNGKKYCFQIWTMGIEPRWWFKRTWKRDKMDGHFIAPYAMSGKFDFQWDKQWCYRGDAWSAGLTYGYVHPVGKWINFEFSLSVGCIRANYSHYQPTDNYEHLVNDPRVNGRTTYFGPTKAKVSLVLPINIKRRQQ